MTVRPTLSVVIPTLNEEGRLPSLLRDLEELADEIVVVDGGSTDATVALAYAHGARVLECAPGRGEQLRTGGEAAASEWLFFVHADCRVSPEASATLRSFIETAGPDDFAHFKFGLEGRTGFNSFIEFGQRVRETVCGLPYGDQGLVLRGALYRKAGGYPDWQLMEDVAILDRLKRHGRRVVLPARLDTSPRRYESEGRIRGWLRNVALMTLYRAGVSPDRLVGWYAPHSGEVVSDSTEPKSRTTVLFAKAPVPGTVKTRLAVDVGEERATHIYRALGRATADALRRLPGRVLVYVDPPEDAAIEKVRDWLGGDGLGFRFQSDGGLGARLDRAVHECLSDTDAVCIVGSDIPGLDAETVERAYGALESHDVVIGPATDGGYYLIALRKELPDLFTGIPWSTSNVLATTLARASDLGLEVALLESKTDVDTVGDLPEALSAL